MRIKCLYRNAKREFKGKNKFLNIFLIILAIAIFLITPGADPSDLFITIPLIMFLGVYKYLILVGILILLVTINFKKFKSLIKRIGRRC